MKRIEDFHYIRLIDLINRNYSRIASNSGNTGYQVSDSTGGGARRGERTSNDLDPPGLYLSYEVPDWPGGPD